MDPQMPTAYGFIDDRCACAIKARNTLQPTTMRCAGLLVVVLTAGALYAVGADRRVAAIAATVLLAALLGATVAVAADTTD